MKNGASIKKKKRFNITAELAQGKLLEGVLIDKNQAKLILKSDFNIKHKAFIVEKLISEKKMHKTLKNIF